MLKNLKKFCTIKIFDYLCLSLIQDIMKKSEICKKLVFEHCSKVILSVTDTDYDSTLSATLHPYQALRFVKKLSPKFSYSYTPIE